MLIGERMEKLIQMIKNNPKHMYRIGQWIIIVILQIFFLAKSISLLDIFIIDTLIFGLMMITKVREMGIGMFLGATNPLIRQSINAPIDLKDFMKEQRELQKIREEAIKEKLYQEMKDQPKN